MPPLVNRRNLLRAIDNKILADLIQRELLDTSTEEDDSNSDDDYCADDSSSDDEAMTTAIVRRYVEETRYLSRRKNLPKTDALSTLIFRSDVTSFKRNARMTREAFDGILKLIEKHPVFQNKSKHPQATPADQLLVALGRLGFDGLASSLWTVGEKLGVGEGTVVVYTKRIIQALLSLEKDVVSWPNKTERKAIKDRIKDQHGFPNCTGYVDGTLIGLGFKPSRSGEDYFTRKGTYAINAMIVCDDQKRIRHVFAGFPGSAHDQRVFSYSKLAAESTKFFANTEYLLADCAYPVSEITIPTYKKPAADLLENKRFNERHSQARITAEHTIGMLKGRFQSLKSLRMMIRNKNDHALAVYWIRACCVLHNLLQTDDYEESWTVPPEKKNHPRSGGEQSAASIKGRAKREMIERVIFE